MAAEAAISTVVFWDMPRGAQPPPAGSTQLNVTVTPTAGGRRLLQHYAWCVLFAVPRCQARRSTRTMWRSRPMPCTPRSSPAQSHMPSFWALIPLLRWPCLVGAAGPMYAGSCTLLRMKWLVQTLGPHELTLLHNQFRSLPGLSARSFRQVFMSYSRACRLVC